MGYRHLNFSIFGGFKKRNFLGYDEIVDIFWVVTTGLFLWGGGGGHLYYIYTFKGFFLRSKFRIGIFLGVLYDKYFWGMPDVPDIFLGVNSR